MSKVRVQGPLDFDGATISILPDLSKHTLDKRRVLKPCLTYFVITSLTDGVSPSTCRCVNAKPLCAP